jgi:hypothetical protein
MITVIRKLAMEAAKKAAQSDLTCPIQLDNVNFALSIIKHIINPF